MIPPHPEVTELERQTIKRVTRRLVALNVSGNRVGSKDSPVTVTVPRLVVNAPPAPHAGGDDHSASAAG